MPYANKIVQREYQRQWMQCRRDSWFSDKVCVKCGSKENLELDHINPNEKSALIKAQGTGTIIWSWAKERRELELAKCQALCDKCHLEKTLEQRRKTTHGTAQMYTKYKCKCELCKAYKRSENKRNRKVITENCQSGNGSDC